MKKKCRFLVVFRKGTEITKEIIEMLIENLPKVLPEVSRDIEPDTILKSCVHNVYLQHASSLSSESMAHTKKRIQNERVDALILFGINSNYFDFLYEDFPTLNIRTISAN